MDFRRTTQAMVQNLTSTIAIRNVFLPIPHVEIPASSQRMPGYQHWLNLSRIAIPLSNSDRSYQILNLFFWLLQIGIVYFFIQYLLKKKTSFGSSEFYLTVVGLYLGNPFVFGLSRWILSENLLFLSLCFYVCFGILFIDEVLKTEKKEKLRNYVPAFLVGLGFGILSPMREYAIVPLLVIPTALVFIGLIWGNRKKVAAFLIPFLPYAYATGIELKTVLLASMYKRHVSEYFIPWDTWIYRTLWQNGFPGLFTLFCLSIILAFKFLRQLNLKTLWFDKSLEKKAFSFLTLAFLFSAVANFVLVMISENRSPRFALPILYSLFGAGAASFVVIPKTISSHRFNKIRESLILILILSAAFQYRDLFARGTALSQDFLAPREFKFPPYENDEAFYNYPLVLPELSDPNAMHVQ